MLRTHAHWGASHPKIRIRRSRNTNLKKTVKSSIKERNGIKMPRNTKEAMLLDKHDGDALWEEAIAKAWMALEEKVCSNFIILQLKFYLTTNGLLCNGRSTSRNNANVEKQ